MSRKKYFIRFFVGVILSCALYSTTVSAEGTSGDPVNKEELLDVQEEVKESEKDAEEVYVAIVNGVGYASLQEAINQAESNLTITLTSDIMENDIEIPDDKTLILDLNGYTFSTNKSMLGEAGLTITDSKETDKSVVEVTDADCIVYETDDSVNIDFLGGSLRMDYIDSAGNPYYTETSLRFGYQIHTKNDASIDSWKWSYGTKAEQLSGVVEGKNKIDTADGFISNIVVTNIPLKRYKTKIYSELYVTYDKGDGKSYLLVDNMESRTVMQLVDDIISDSESTDQEIEYARQLKKLYDEENKWTGYH